MKKYFKKKSVRYTCFVLEILLFIIGIVGVRYYILHNRPNIKVENSAVYLYIPTGATMEQVLDSLRKMKVLKVENRFISAANSKICK